MSNPGVMRAGAKLTVGSGKETTDSLAPATLDVNELKRVLTNIGGPWHLARTGLWAGRTFRNLDDAVDAVLRANQQHCVYFLANTPKGGRLRGRRRETDIARVNAVFLDIDDTDPDIVGELADRLDWPPTYIAFTGGGYQAMWRLSEPVAPAVGKAISVWLQMEFEDLSPDATHSVDHLFRLPGTRNRKANRNGALVRILQDQWDAVLPVAEAGRAEVKQRRPAVVLDLPESDRWWEPEDMLPPWARRLLSHAVDSHGEPFQSRSEHEWAFIGACYRAKVPLEDIRDLMLDQRYLVSHRAYYAKVKGKFVPRRNPLAHVMRQLGQYVGGEVEQ